jgi:hypothetical protein
VNRWKWDWLAENGNSTAGRCSFWKDISLARYGVTILIDFSILQSISKGYGKGDGIAIHGHARPTDQVAQGI